MEVNIEIDGFEELEARLQKMDQARFEAIAKLQAADMVDRATASHEPAKGGTPYKSGELIQSVNKRERGKTVVVGYTKAYAPHVEYGHRTVNGGYVQGQRFLQKNVEIQREQYKKDLGDELKKVLKG